MSCHPQHKTIESVLERGEKLDNLVERSNALSAQSKMFYKTAKKVRFDHTARCKTDPIGSKTRAVSSCEGIACQEICMRMMTLSTSVDCEQS